MRPVSLLIALISLATATVLPAQITGKEAMRIVGRDRGADYLPRMLHLYGLDGLPQPAVWRVVARDGKGAVREFFVSKGSIISEGVIPPEKANGISATPLPMHRLNIDSTEAFAKVEAAARASKIGFDRLHYQLRCLELSNNAAWFLTLVNAQGLRVGEVSVGASTGTILTTTWYPVPAPLPGGPPPEPPGFLDRAKDGINRGAEGVRRGIGNAAGWIQRKVAPNQ